MDPLAKAGAYKKQEAERLLGDAEGAEAKFRLSLK